MRFDDVFLAATPANVANEELIGRLSRQEDLPTIVLSETTVSSRLAGCSNYAPDTNFAFRRAASYVDRILKGADPASLPVEVPSEFVLEHQPRHGKGAGPHRPSALLARATRIIE